MQSALIWSSLRQEARGRAGAAQGNYRLLSAHMAQHNRHTTASEGQPQITPDGNNFPVSWAFNYCALTGMFVGMFIAQRTRGEKTLASIREKW
eukprot:1161083-Pelagomonas_calceolata.AAC.4